MTVCVAALSSKGNCIICIADKSLSYGDYIQWDSDSSKIVPLWDDKAVALTSSGDEGHLSRLMAQLTSLPPSYGRQDLWKYLEDRFQLCTREAQEIAVLRPIGITRLEYLEALRTANKDSVIFVIKERMEKFSFDCDLIVCGYDSGRMPFIFHLQPPGKVTDYTSVGFHANGSGAEKAISQLLFAEHKRTNGVARTVYECFDAKAHAEMAIGVGYEWDSFLVTFAGAKPISEEIKPLVDRAWAKVNRSPFETRKDDELPDPPDDWYGEMRKIIRKSLGLGMES